MLIAYAPTLGQKVGKTSESIYIAFNDGANNHSIRPGVAVATFEELPDPLKNNPKIKLIDADKIESKELQLEDALFCVNAHYDKTLLKSFVGNDKRKEVLKALEGRIKIIEEEEGGAE